MERELIERVDVFPYRHHVGETMSSPPVTALPEASLADAARLIGERRISSVLVVDGDRQLLGIVTEHDIVRTLAREGAAALERKLATVMAQPVATVPADAFLYTALARMARRGFRQLAVTDPVTGALAGVISAGALLKERANQALMLGDEIAEARTGAEMARVRRRLAALAHSLLAERLSALDVAAVLSAVLRDISARAAELAAQSLAADGRGPAPAAWCFLVLGSGGRGESLLAADQDNALIHAGRDTQDDGWFAELGRRACDLLDAAGVPYCRGKVMASESACRHSLEGWHRQVAEWIRHPDAGALLSIDIFYDFQPVHGDRRLAEALRADAMEAARDRALHSRLSAVLDERTPALGMFGRFRVVQGRVDLKRGGLLPITAGARILALKAGVPATSTSARLEGAAKASLINASDLAGLQEAQEIITRAILEQQVIDLEARREPSTLVEVRRLTRFRRSGLKRALRLAAAMDVIVKNALLT